MTDQFKKAQPTRPAVVCRPAPKPDIPERRKSLRQGDRLVVAGSRNSFILEVSTPEPEHGQSDNG